MPVNYASVDAGLRFAMALLFLVSATTLDQLMNFFKILTMACGFLWLAKANMSSARVDAPSTERLTGGKPCGR